MDRPAGNANDEQRDTRTASSGSRPCPNCGNYHAAESGCVPSADPNPSSAPEQDSAALLERLINQTTLETTDDIIGKTIGGKYQLISLLGKGGMSRVYKATQMLINRTVALKLMLPQLSQDKESVKRFLQEAQAAGQVSHPNVVGVIDFGLAEDNQPYLVMDYLEGDNMAQVLKRKKRIPVKDAIAIFIQICEGLAAAHEHGIVHRDIKPSNIVLQNVPEGSRVRVVDFGIAKMVDAQAQQQHLTKTGEVFGSPFYMSPEQCEGSKLDTRSDIYSLGVVFYECLTGVVPLAGNTAIETMSLHMQSVPPSLRQAAGDLNDIPLSLENLVFKMMERSREKRYANMQEIVRDLKQIALGESEALSGSISYVRREVSRRSRIIGLALISVAVSVLVGVIAFPHACLALAKEKFNGGVDAFARKDYANAEANYRLALYLSKQAANPALQNRCLIELISVYRVDDKPALLEQARHLRRELLKEELSRFDLNDDSINHLLASNRGLNDGNMSANYSDIDEVSHSNTSLQAGLQNSFRKKKERAGAPGPVNLGTFGTVAHGSADFGASGFGSGGGGAAGYTGFPVMVHPGVPANPSAAPAPTISQAKPVWKPLLVPLWNYSSNTMDADDMLDHYQSIVEVCMQKKRFLLAKRCADRAISLCQMKNIQSNGELSKLYSARAWSQLNLGRANQASDDVTESLERAQAAHSAADQATAEGIQSAIYLYQGKPKAAQECYGRACSLLSSGAEESSVLNEAMKYYNKKTADPQ